MLSLACACLRRSNSPSIRPCSCDCISNPRYGAQTVRLAILKPAGHQWYLINSSMTEGLPALVSGGPIVVEIPADKLGNPLLEGRGGAQAGEGVQRLAVGPGGVHVTCLHRQHPLDGGFADGLFQRLDKIEQPYRLAVTDIEDAVGGCALGRALLAGVPIGIGAGRLIGDGEDPRDDVIYVGEVAAESAVVVHIDRLTREDGASELDDGHVGPPPGAVDGKEAQPCGGQAIERRVGVGHQLATLLGGGVEGDRVIHLLRGGVGHLIPHAIDRAGGGVDEVLDPVVTTPFQHRQHTGEVAVGIGERIVDGVTHPRLRPQMDHPLETMTGKESRHRFAICQIQPLEVKMGETGQLGQPRLFQTHLVVVVEVVDPHHLMTCGAQLAGHMKADKTGDAGDQIDHGWVSGLQLVLAGCFLAGRCGRPIA
ncbi:hypothetical protein AERO8C_120094 [Aeromonas veronii]|uniref:Uncharacterized protein n=1 Tax=Aeromonas veronii TaxID=654 RepID=A0A653KR51_AERVE|nr:hypothetical protein AERO8C_120094 [Aeromonas veronii]